MMYQPIPVKHCRKCGEWKVGTTEYFSPRPRNGHERDHLDIWCKACHNRAGKARKRRFREKHPAKSIHEITYPTGMKYCSGCQRVLPATLEYFSKRDKHGLQSRCKECRASEYRANKEHYSASTKEWATANRDKRRASKHNRIARKKQAEGTHTAADVRRQYKAQKGKCYWCGEAIGETYHVDHVIPLQRGGSNGPENLVIACAFCNESKGDKPPHEWKGSGGKLL